jgi:hypothetical protein
VSVKILKICNKNPREYCGDFFVMKDKTWTEQTMTKM